MLTIAGMVIAGFGVLLGLTIIAGCGISYGMGSDLEPDNGKIPLGSAQRLGAGIAAASLALLSFLVR